MLWLLVVTQVLILVVIVGVPVYLWRNRDRYLMAFTGLVRQWDDVVGALGTLVSLIKEQRADEFRRQHVSSAYVAGTITLANANQVYNILALVRAQLDANCPGAARSFNLYATHANTAQVLVGSSAMTATSYAYSLNPDDMHEYESTYQNIPFGYLSAMSTAAGQQLGVEVMVM